MPDCEKSEYSSVIIYMKLKNVCNQIKHGNHHGWFEQSMALLLWFVVIHCVVFQNFPATGDQNISKNKRGFNIRYIHNYY